MVQETLTEELSWSWPKDCGPRIRWTTIGVVPSLMGLFVNHGDWGNNMLCLNCHKEIPDDAKVCQYCEATVEPGPTSEQIQVVRELRGSLDEETRKALDAAFLSSKTREDFINKVMVGACPKCGSTEVSDCENDPDIGDICIGRCFECGQLWCLECGRLLETGQIVCGCCDS